MGMTIIEQMLENYTLNNIEDEKNAIKEIVQEVTLAGLARTDFFRYAAFYGGTALRLFYGLNRFSEDLDFTLLSPSDDFRFEKYISAVTDAVESLGLVFETKVKKKRPDSNIQSAFLKGNTKEQFLLFYPNSKFTKQLGNNEKIRVKFEIDVNPPKYATTEFKYRLLPYNYRIQVYDKPSLFAGKLHAVLARKWKNRIKGRDFYDYVFYLANNIPVNLQHLEARLQQTRTIDSEITLTLESLKDLLCERFNEIDFEQAKEDVLPFIKDDNELELWSSEFFKAITENLKSS
jgi:predicted nucleotidyltransferase component of viral defense system